MRLPSGIRFNFVSLVVGRMFLCITVLCLGLGKSGTVSQIKILSKRPMVTMDFDSERNESTVSTSFFDYQSGDLVARAMRERDPDYTPPRLRLLRAEYKTPGTVLSRPQTVAFVLSPLSKYKNAPHFSVTADGVLFHEGEASIDELCCEKVDGHEYTLQRIIIAVPTEMFERIAKVKKVEFKLTAKSDKYSFKLNDYERKCISALASTIK